MKRAWFNGSLLVGLSILLILTVSRPTNEDISTNVDVPWSCALAFLNHPKINASAFQKNCDFFVIQDRKDINQVLIKAASLHAPKKFNDLLPDIIKLSLKFKVDPLWVFSIIQVESSFNENAKSKKNAIGLMQILPPTGSFLLKKLYKIEVPADSVGTFLSDPLINLEMGIAYLRILLNYFDNDYLSATVAYNMGPTWLKKKLDSDGINAINSFATHKYFLKVKDIYQGVTYKLYEINKATSNKVVESKKFTFRQFLANIN